MKALVLDFDGVISDSAREAFVVARRAYLELHSDSALTRADDGGLFEGFRALMPLGNRAEDYGTALAALEAEVDLPDQAAYDAFRGAREPAWLERYHQRFYDVREELSQEDPEGWRGLMRPYAPVLEILRRRRGEAAYAIATSKDRRSVGLLLRAYGIADLVSRRAGPGQGDRPAQERPPASGRSGSSPCRSAQLTFVDDKVNHLDTVAPLGRPLRAGRVGLQRPPGARGWPVSGGYLLCTLDDAEALLFD